MKNYNNKLSSPIHARIEDHQDRCNVTTLSILKTCS